MKSIKIYLIIFDMFLCFQHLGFQRKIYQFPFVTILHWFPVKTEKSGSRITVKQLPESNIYQSLPEAWVYDYFSCISHEFILTVIEKYKCKHSTIF